MVDINKTLTKIPISFTFILLMALMTFFGTTFFQQNSFAIDSRYYSDQYDDDDKKFFLEQDRLEREQRKNRRKNKTITQANEASTKGRKKNEQYNKDIKDGKMKDNKEAKKTNNKNTNNEDYSVPANCYRDAVRFCKIKRQHKASSIKSNERCLQKLRSKWRMLSTICQLAMSGYDDGSFSHVETSSMYVNGIKLSRTTIGGKAVRNPKRPRKNR